MLLIIDRMKEFGGGVPIVEVITKSGKTKVKAKEKLQEPIAGSRYVGTINAGRLE